MKRLKKVVSIRLNTKVWGLNKIEEYEMNNWIKCSDELPDDCQWCVICVDSEPLDVACYDDNMRCWQGYEFSYKHESISHWLALPPPPPWPEPPKE